MKQTTMGGVGTLVNERLLYWYEYKKWIDSNMCHAKEIGQRCVKMVFKNNGRGELPLLTIEEIFGL